MTNQVRKGPDGKYHVKGKVYDLLVGSRAQVWHGTAYKTAGGLKRNELLMNKWGRIVSKAKSVFETKRKRLQKHGYTAKKGKFGAVKITPKGKGRKTMKKRK